MNTKFYTHDGALIWTGDLGFPIPRIGERMTFNFPADNNYAAGIETNKVKDIRYDVHPGMGGSSVIVTLDKPEPS